ncbi:MAG: hypothetical protein QOG85_388 [Gaiellaceae bacterium]|jgi:hypothetical protein|nr:hypothetical protein [Gaiellaceae bacterium]
MTYAKSTRRLRSRSVWALVVVAAIVAGIMVTLAGGATAANHPRYSPTRQSKSTAHLENVSDPNSRDVGFTG